MNSYQYILRKLRAWAQRNDIQLQAANGEHGEPNYTHFVGENIFGGAIHEAVAAAYAAGAGGELNGEIPRMSALHSSSALAVNLFQYWVVNGDIGTLAQLLQVPNQNILGAQFEDTFPVVEDPELHGLQNPPHLDFAFRYRNGGRIGIECKLSEPYRDYPHPPLSQAYLDLPDAWNDLPASQALAEQLVAGPAEYHRLGPSQLLKHILGLTFQTPTNNVRLIYLYLDAIGDQAAEHRREIEQFQEAIADDQIRFIPMSVQEFILRAVRQVRADHTEYVDYLAERYL